MKVITVHGSFLCKLCGQRNLVIVLCTGIKGQAFLCRECARELTLKLIEHGNGNAATE